MRQVLLAALFLHGFGACAAEPALTLLTAFPPGGGADAVARLLAPRLAAALGQPVVVENKAGASGNLAAQQVARADTGAQILLMHNSTLPIGAVVGMRQSFDLRRDLIPLAAVASTPIVVAAGPSVQARGIDDLLAIGKSKSLAYGSCGNGSPQHLAGAQLTAMAGVEMTHVPYRGCAPPVIDAVAGTVPLVFNTIPNLEPQVKAGRLRYLAVATAKRLASHPDVPTVAETPGLEGFTADVWFAVFAPSRMRQSQRDAIERALLDLAADPEFRIQLQSRLFTPLRTDGKSLKRQMDEEMVAWKRLAARYQIVAE